VREFDKADEVATAPAAVTVEQVFLRVDVEGGMSVLMKRTKSGELGAVADPMSSPVVSLQVLSGSSGPDAEPRVFPSKDGPQLALLHTSTLRGCGRNV
jgi:hypothetical protein